MHQWTIAGAGGEGSETLQRIARVGFKILWVAGAPGGAWPFLVGGLPCQVDSGNERDLSLLNSPGRLVRPAPAS